MWSNPGWEQDLWGCPSHADEKTLPLCTLAIQLLLILPGSLTALGYFMSRD